MSDERDSHDAEPEDLDVPEELVDDVKGGQRTAGRRSPTDIVITKEIDKGSPS
jgi:hypothetical protein